jgi:hypothetical protein
VSDDDLGGVIDEIGLGPSSGPAESNQTDSGEKQRPLWQRSRTREVNRKRGLASVIANLRLEDLVREFEEDRREAPSRKAVLKPYFDYRREGYPHGEAPSNRREENLMIALFNEGSIRLHDGVSELLILDYQTPLYARRNDGLGKIDGLGLTPAGSLCLMELKSPSKGNGDSPLRALLECLSYAAAELAVHEVVTEEITSLSHRRSFGHFVDGRTMVLVFGPWSWWDRWLNSRPAGDWTTPLAELSECLATSLNIDVAYGALEGFEFTKDNHGSKSKKPKIQGKASLADVPGLPGVCC